MVSLGAFSGVTALVLFELKDVVHILLALFTTDSRPVWGGGVQGRFREGRGGGVRGLLRDEGGNREQWDKKDSRC